MTTGCDLWGPWTDHTGDGCPIPDGIEVITFTEWPGGKCLCGIGSNYAAAKAWDWSYFGKMSPAGRLYGRVLRYRIQRTPQVQLLVQLAERVGENA